MWRLFLEYGTPPSEIDRTYTIEDVLDANEALDVAADVDAWRGRRDQAKRAQEQAIREATGGGRYRGR